MPSPAYFAQFGILAIPRLLTPDTCARVREAIDGAVAGKGSVWNPHDGQGPSPIKQRTEFIGLADQLQETLISALNAVRANVGEHFAEDITELQPLMFARYDAHDFYGVHSDVSHHPDAPPAIRNRKVSLVVFLNEQSDDPEPGCYCGGRLTFHGLDDTPPWNRLGHPLDAEEGLMIAFRPHLPHEVTHVTWGSRYSMVSWFC